MRIILVVLLLFLIFSSGCVNDDKIEVEIGEEKQFDTAEAKVELEIIERPVTEEVSDNENGMR